MILIISENDQIIGADEEFLEDKGLDYIKENFPSMSIFLLQSENGTFNFTYNEKEYIVTKHPITMDITNANLYCFEIPKDNMETQSNQETQPIIEPKKNNNDSLNTPFLEENEISSLDTLKQTNSEDSLANQELNFETASPSNDSNNEMELDLDLGFDSLTESKGIDIGVDGSNDGVISISKEEIEADLKQASQELGIDNATLQEFFKDFKQQLVDEKEIFFKAIENKDYETLHKSSHKLKGVALNLRLNKFAELLKNSDNLAKEKADITKIQKIIENIYSAIGENKETENSSITIETNLNDDEKTILLKAVVNFLEEIQTKDLESIKEEILNAYNIVPIKEFKDIEKIDNLNEANNFITNLIEKIKKEIK